VNLKNIDIFEHTADVGLRLERPSREQLFRDAAMGMFYIIAPDNLFEPTIEFTVTVDGADDEELMVSWLSELNFYFQTKQYVPVEMDIDIIDNHLVAQIKCDKVDRQRHNIEIEIKAVTFHKIYVKPEKDMWTAQVIFDI
jgi:SHS2 domain-containing protein